MTAADDDKDKDKDKNNKDSSDVVKFHADIKRIPAEDINPNQWNPNFVSDPIYKAIVSDIKDHGFIGSVTVQKYNKQMQKTNVIINGEHRYRALCDLGVKEIPVTI